MKSNERYLNSCSTKESLQQLMSKYDIKATIEQIMEEITISCNILQQYTVLPKTISSLNPPTK